MLQWTADIKFTDGQCADTRIYDVRLVSVQKHYRTASIHMNMTLCIIKYFRKCSYKAMC